MTVDLSVDLAPKHKTGFPLRNPVITASGTFGYGTEYAALLDTQRLGAIVSKGITWSPRKGNRQPRIAETPAGMLNSIGLQNVGVKAVISKKAPVWAAWDVPVIVNIAGESFDEFRRLAAALDGVRGVAALEVNISCPNVDQGGLEFGCDPLAAAEVTRVVKQESGLPVIVKLTPNVTDIGEQAIAVAQAGADAITAINTVVGMVIDVRRRRPVIARGMAGLSGPAIRPIALAMVYKIAGAVAIPIIGCGGIFTADDALQFFMAGASAVQVGTASFVEPQAATRIIDGLRDYLDSHGHASIKDIVGVARLPAPQR